MTSSPPSCGTPLRPGGYCNSIQKVRLFPCLKRTSLIFQMGNFSSSSGSSCSSGSDVPSYGSMDASFKDSRAEAATSLKEIAGRIFLDGYTRSLIIHALCGEARRHGGAQLALQTVFGDLDVAWVLDLETSKIDLKKLEQDRTALDDLVERWSRALTVMVKVFHITWSDLQDQKLGGLAVKKAPGSAPAPGTGLASRAYPSSEGSGTSDSLFTDDASASSRRLSVKSVMAAYSLWGNGIADADQDEEAQFAGFAQASVLRMLAFADAVAGVQRAPENLLRTLDAYASVCDSAPLLLQMFAGFRRDAISAKIESTSRLLSDAVRVMMNDAKASIVAHVSASPAAQSGCDVLETVRCAMDDITLLFNNYRSLNIFLQQDDDVCFMFDFEGVSTLSYLIVELISCLEDSIEVKSRTYSDRTMRYMFLLNNSHYVLERVEAIDLYPERDRMNEPANELMKEPTDLTSSVSVLKQKIESYIKSYLESSWLRVTSCLSAPRRDGNCWSHCIGTCPSLVQFNSEFKRTYATQKLWKVPNPQLRKRLRESISNKVVQDYSTHFHHYPGSRSSAIYTSEEMTELLAELFEG